MLVILVSSPDLAVNCGDPGTPTNGQRSLSSTTYNSVVTYTCDVGYALQGAHSRTCQSNGQWSGNVPQCQRTLSGIPYYNSCSIHAWFKNVILHKPQLFPFSHLHQSLSKWWNLHSPGHVQLCYWMDRNAVRNWWVNLYMYVTLVYVTCRFEVWLTELLCSWRVKEQLVTWCHVFPWQGGHEFESNQIVGFQIGCQLHCRSYFMHAMKFLRIWVALPDYIFCWAVTHSCVLLIQQWEATARGVLCNWKCNTLVFSLSHVIVTLGMCGSAVFVRSYQN